MPLNRAGSSAVSYNWLLHIFIGMKSSDLHNNEALDFILCLPTRAEPYAKKGRIG